MPRTRPSSSQRSPGVKRSMSRYQATLRSTSLTVSDTANERRRRDSGCRRWRCRARVFRGAARRVFFLVAMEPTLLGRRETSVALGRRPRQITLHRSRRRSHAYESRVRCLGRQAQGRQGQLQGRQRGLQRALYLRHPLRGRQGDEPRGTDRRRARRVLQHGAVGGPGKARQAGDPRRDVGRLHHRRRGRRAQNHEDGARRPGQGTRARPGGVPEGRRRGEARLPRVEGARRRPPDHVGREAGVSWTVYLLRCRDGSLYTGITNDLPRRLARHRAGTASAYTRARRPLRLAYTEGQPSRSAALRRGGAPKRLSPAGEVARGGRPRGPPPPARARRGASLPRGPPRAGTGGGTGGRTRRTVGGRGSRARRGRGVGTRRALEIPPPYPVLPFILHQSPQFPPSPALYPPLPPLPPGLMRWPAPALDDGP